jgi:hypothetical protein
VVFGDVSYQGKKLESSDIDIFFETESRFQETYSKFKDQSIKKPFANDRNLSLRLDNVPCEVQLVGIGLYPTISHLIDSFDYTICMLGIDSKDGIMFVGNRTLYDIGSKKLCVNKITYPIASMRRIIKYVKYGYYMCPLEMAEFLKQSQSIDLSIESNLLLYID